MVDNKISSGNLNPFKDSILNIRSAYKVSIKDRNTQRIQINRIQKEFSRAEEYSAEYEQPSSPTYHFFNCRIQRTLAFLSNFQNGNLLDAGCGPSLIGNFIADRSIHFYGIDLSKEMLLESKKNFELYPNFNFLQGDINFLPFEDSAFDVVLFLGSFEYILNPFSTLFEVSRVLKPNGILIVSMLNKYCLYRFLQSYLYYKFLNFVSYLKLYLKNNNRGYCNVSNKPKTKVYKESILIRMLSEVGFVVENSVYYDYRLIPSPFDIYFPSLSLFVSEFFEAHNKIQSKYLTTGYILKCRNVIFSNGS